MTLKPSMTVCNDMSIKLDYSIINTSKKGFGIGCFTTMKYFLIKAEKKDYKPISRSFKTLVWLNVTQRRRLSNRRPIYVRDALIVIL